MLKSCLRIRDTELIWYLCVALSVPCQATFPMDAPVVSTTLGKIHGTTDFSRLNKMFFQYLGIPYAYEEPPEGELRFEAPVPWKKPWSGVRAAYSWGSACLQFDAVLKGRVEGAEDCLFLNVFTPTTSPSKLLPVLVWVHGGGFVAGSSDMYDPKYFMDHDLVIVSMNYRLASLGFLNTGDELIRGNMGLKDQNLALRFVQDNIKAFGGDPDRVTLLGESAGAASVHYHIISPLSKGLFHRAIMQSGNVFCPWAHTRSPQKQAMKFGKSVGCPTSNTSALVNCLKNLNGRDIVKQHANILSPIHTQDEFFPGSVEAVVREDTFLSDNPFMMLKRGEFNHVPVIFGVNSGDGALKTARLEATPQVLNTLDTKWDDYVPILLHYNPELKNVSTKLREYYFPYSHLRSPQNSLENVTTMISDGLWNHAIKEAALHHAKYAPVYLNYFSYHSDFLPSTYTFIKAARVRNNLPAELTWPRYMLQSYLNQFLAEHLNPKRFGACHGDDLMYYWSTNPVVQIRPFSQDYEFSKDLVASMADFALSAPQLKFGNVSWEAVNNNETDSAKLRYMKLDVNGKMIDEPFRDRVAFINSLDIRNHLDPNNW